jgi:hypothetical protein
MRRTREFVIREEEGMGIRNLARAAMLGATALTLVSSQATSQGVTYSNSWTFNQGTCSALQCRFGGYTLQWGGPGPLTWLPQSGGFLGGYATMNCSSSCNYGHIITGSTFLLTIEQNGSNSGVGPVGGLGWNSNPGQLRWTVTINGNTHGRNDDDGCEEGCNNDPPPGNFTPNLTESTNDVTTTPEPATFSLMATGLLGLIPVVRRRRKN